MKKTTKRLSNNVNPVKSGRHFRNAGVILLGAILLFTAAGCGNLSDTDTTATSEETTETTEVTEAETTEETVLSNTTSVCYIAETEKEKALALQEYIETSLQALAEADTEEIDAEIEVADAGTESSTSSSSSGSSSSSEAMSDIYGKEFDVPDSNLKYIINEDGTVTYIVDDESDSSSSSSSSSSSTTEHTHTWETYTYTEETDWINPVQVDVFECGCGKVYLIYSNADACALSHGIGSVSHPGGYVTMDTGWVTYTTYSGYKCSECGATKDIAAVKSWTESTPGVYHRVNECEDY